MATSVLDDKDKYSEIELRIARVTGLVLPLLAVGYGILAFYDMVPRSSLFSVLAFLLTSLFFSIIGISQFLRGYRSERSIAVYLVLAHLIGGSYVIWVSGLESPVLMLWVILIFISQLFFGKTAMLYSVAALCATGFIGYAIDESLSLKLLITYIVYILSAVSVAMVVTRMRTVQVMEHDDLVKTQEQEELHKSQLMTLINSISEPIISISSQGTIRIYNAAALNILDTNQTLTGKNIDDVFNIYNQAGEPVKLLSMLPDLTHLVERDDLSHRFADSEEIRLSISAAPIKQAFSSQFLTNEGYLFIFRDITKTKSLEEERDEFISVISHELRTPITIVEGTISNATLLLDRGSMKPEDIKKTLHDAHEQILFLASMVNDLGTLSRAERGVGDEPEEIKVNDLLHELYARYQPRAVSEGLTLDLDASPRLGSITASRLYLEEVLQNFITNAIKYTKEGTVTIIAKRHKDGIEFAVKDSGIGISKSDLKHVFEKFYRSEDYRTRETSGTGLGLYVVQKLAKKLKIKIEVTSRLNHGSTFSFVLKDK